MPELSYFLPVPAYMPESLLPKTLLQMVTRLTEAHPGSSPFKTAIEGLILLGSPREKRPDYLIHKPALCIVVQGAMGYESTSQFSREYTRMFGAPPRRDIVRMQA